MLAYALARAGQRGEAIVALRKLIGRHPSLADAWHNLGNLLRAERNLEGAAHAFRRAAALEPANVDAELNASYVLAQLGRFTDAEAQVRAALRRFPDEPDLWVNLAQIRRATRRWDSALTAVDHAITRAPQNAGYRITRSLALRDAGDTDRALAELSVLIGEQPHEADARFARAQILLSLGDYRAGWSDYLWRPERTRWLAARAKAPGTPAPELGSLRAKRVRVHGEQGLGDTLFFLRFVPLLAQIASQVQLNVDMRLSALLPSDWNMPGATDAEVLVGDLPAILDAVPEPSLRMSSDARLRPQLDACGPPPYIGITWQAGLRWEEMASPGQLFKEVPPKEIGEALRPIAGTLICVQRNARADELELLRNGAKREVHDFSWVNTDLRDALALLASLDDYVAVSNTNVHLSEALGRRMRVLVAHPAEWRWTHDQETSPWFRHARLYRQSSDGSWAAALARLARDVGR